MLENICRLVQNFINTQKLKSLLETCFDKLKDKKSLVKNELFSLFNMVVENRCLEGDKFILFILQFCTNQKKENSQVKMGLLEYIKYLFLQQNNVLFYEINKIKEKELFIFVKKIVIIIQKESLSSVKDLCSDLLIIIKRRVEDEEYFYELISELPNYRKKIIKEEGVEEKEEGEYKKNLRRIKSSYSFSKTKYSNGFRKNNFDINTSEKKEKNNEKHKNKFDRINSTDKINIKTKNILNKKEKEIKREKSKNNTRTNFKINNNIKSKTGGLAKFNPKNKNNKKINNSNINVEKKKENLLDNIHNLDINGVEKYSKVMISDFLIFVKKVCNEEKKEEDLSYHFNLIFIIFEKFLYRIIVLLNENKEKKEKYIKLKKLLDEYISNICKVIIITPCIEQINGSNKFDICLLETFMEKIKNFSLNKEKFYMNLLLSLYKFCEKDEAFPPELNPKSSVFYFLNYLKSGYFETKSEKLFNVLKEFITETKYLNEQEKKELLIENDETNNENENIVTVEENNCEKNSEENEVEQENQENNNSKENVSDNEEEENKKTEIYNNKIKDEIMNNDNNNNNINGNENEINKINTNNIMTKLRQFQEKLNKIPNLEKDKEKETTKEETDKKESNINENENKNNKMEESEDSISEDIKEDNNNNINNKSNILKLNDNDFAKIEDSIKIMSKRLDNTLNKMSQVSNRNNNRRNNYINNINNINTNSINNLNSINNSINISKISDNNNASIMTSESLLKNNFININNNNKSKELIDQLIKVIKGELNQINIYQKIKEYFKSLNTLEEKLDFIKTLKNNLENPTYIEIIPINSCTNLFDFIINILSYQILTQSNYEQIIVELQGISEKLINYRQLNDMFKIMLFLLKKYFPKNLNNKIEDISLVMIKVITYLLKELLKKINKNNIQGRDIISEINDLFTITPPSTLTTATPNAMFYKHIFTLLKSITDQIISNNKDDLVNIIQYLQDNKIVCEDYIQYLIRIQKKSN